MTFLPIVGRELRVAARKRATYWSRVIAAASMLVVFAGMVWLDALGSSGWGTQLGKIVFQTLSWMTFAYVCVSGLFLTSDALSEEKREGTLGLLFLTDLRGMDVVLGKLLAGSLRGVYALVAVLPVIGLSFLIGGMSGGEFWRLTLALVNTLFFALAAGIMISAVSRQGQRAMFGTAALCFVFIGLTWLGDLALAGWDFMAFQRQLSLASPINLLVEMDSPAGSGTYWTTMGIVQGLGWGFLVAACLLAPRTWQEKTTRAEKARRRWRGSPEKQAAWRRRLFEGNPVRWLAARGAGFRHVANAVLAGVLALTVWLAVDDMQGGFGLFMVITQLGQWLLSFALTLALASVASRFFVEAAQSGALELMLASPLPARDIVRGQWWALRRTFLVPALLVLGVKVTAALHQLFQMGSWTAINDEHVLAQLVQLGLSAVSYFTTLLAVAWFGMWMGVTTRKANAAVMKTLVFVCVLPWFALMFTQGILSVVFSFLLPGAGTGAIPYWIYSVAAGALWIGAQLGFFLLARRKLLRNFRELVARASGLKTPRRKAVPPVLPAAPSAPPPLATPA